VLTCWKDLTQVRLHTLILSHVTQLSPSSDSYEEISHSTGAIEAKCKVSLRIPSSFTHNGCTEWSQGNRETPRKEEPR
jgi:hypothetical protein